MSGPPKLEIDVIPGCLSAGSAGWTIKREERVSIEHWIRVSCFVCHNIVVMAAFGLTHRSVFVCFFSCGAALCLCDLPSDCVAERDRPSVRAD